MYISKIRLHNFRGFKGDHELAFNSGINFFVGNNNCGKTSLFRAIEFVQSGKDAEQYITKDVKDGEYVSVEVELAGAGLKELINAADALSKYKPYIIDDSGAIATLKIMRSSEETEIKQNGKAKQLTIKNVRVFNPVTNQYENPTGIDTTISALFETQFVWAGINIEDVTDVSKTKICGRIINKIINNNSESWSQFVEAHSKAFKDIQAQLRPIEQTLKSKMGEQYGETEIEFVFSLPELSEFLKFGTINLSDNGIQTTSTDKGTGMQRALALSIIQVYAELESKIDDSASKPLFFFLDEPETFLHPKAQSRLLTALDKIAETSQIFISTHSPYMLRSFNNGRHALYIFSKEGGVNHVETANSFGLLGSLSPTWGEINYRAFGVSSCEFHNELYGFLQEKAITEDEGYYEPKKFDEYLSKKSQVFTLDKDYKHLKANGTISQYKTTLATYIRNVIHHPENTHNVHFSSAELEESIQELIKIIETIV